MKFLSHNLKKVIPLSIATTALLFSSMNVQAAVSTQEAYLKPTSLFDYGNFGASIAVGEDLVVVGSYEGAGAGPFTGNGTVYVYRRSGLTWNLEAELRASNGEPGDHFGSSVAVYEDKIVVGAPREDSDGSSPTDNSLPHSGAVYVFTDDGTGKWTEAAYIKPSVIDSYDSFGSAVSIHDDYIIVGAPTEDSSANSVNGNAANNINTASGAAYIFGASSPWTSWSQRAYLKARNNDAGDWFGFSVDITDGVAIVGAPHEDSQSRRVNRGSGNNSLFKAGAAYVFRKNAAGNWNPDAYLKAPNPDSLDEFGYSVSIGTDRVAVGAIFEDSNATGIHTVFGPGFAGGAGNNLSSMTGAAYTFTHSAGSWGIEAYIKSSDANIGATFGTDIELTQDATKLIVGSHQENSASTGVNSIPTPASADSGAAFLFEYSASWSQSNYLKASNTDAGDSFGSGVGIYNNTVAVGAFGEDSNSTTAVGGDEADNSENNIGAAYIFQ